MVENNKPTQLVAAVAFILASNWLLWLVGGTAIALRARWRHSNRRIHFQMLGAVLAFVSPLVAMLAVQYVLPVVLPDLVHSSRPKETPVEACLLAGLLVIPFGLPASWTLWRLGIPSLAEQFADELGGVSRAWHNIPRKRFWAILLLVPLPAALAAVLEFVLPVHDGHPSAIPTDLWLKAAAWIFPTAAVLTMGGGKLFFATLSRVEKGISRGNCVFFGASIALLLPAASAGAGFAIQTAFAIDALPTNTFFTGSILNDMGFFFFIGTLLVPLGMAGGWLLWQGAVAPVPNPIPIGAAKIVFD